MNPENEMLLKILLMGNSGAGKSSLSTRFIDNTFEENPTCVN